MLVPHTLCANVILKILCIQLLPKTTLITWVNIVKNCGWAVQYTCAHVVSDVPPSKKGLLGSMSPSCQTQGQFIYKLGCCQIGPKRSTHQLHGWHAFTKYDKMQNNSYLYHAEKICGFLSSTLILLQFWLFLQSCHRLFAQFWS